MYSVLQKKSPDIELFCNPMIYKNKMLLLALAVRKYRRKDVDKATYFGKKCLLATTVFSV